MHIQKSEVGRRPYLDGLRGVAACMVLFAHLMIALLPSVVTFSRGEGHVYWFEKALGLSAFGWIWNGEFAVCIFFVLSGYVLSEFCKTTRISFPAQVARRYVRLAAPMLITSFFAYLLMKLGLYKNLDAATGATQSGWLSMWYRGFEPSLFGMAYEALVDAFVQGRANYNSNLWTMKIELIGSIFVFVVHALFKNVYIRAGVLLVYAWINHNYFYSLFAMGALLYDFEDMAKAYFARAVPDEELRQKIALAGFLFGVYLGSYPHIQPNMVATWHYFLPAGIHTMGWHMIGSVILMGSLLLSNVAQRWLGGPFGQYLGRISFVLYLVHLPIICSFTAWSAYLLRGLPYALNLAITAPLTVAVVFGVSTLLYRYVDVYTTSLSRDIGKLVDAWLPVSLTKPALAPALPMPATAESPLK